MKKIFVLALLTLTILAADAKAEGREASVEAGWGFAVTGLSDVFDTKNGLSLRGHYLMDLNVVPNLMVGGEVGYLRMGKAEVGTGETSITTTLSAYPILAMGKYTLLQGVYALGGLGVSWLRSSYDFGANITEAQRATYEGDTSVYFTMMGGAGYSYEFLPAMSIDPRVKLYLIFGSDTVLEAIPSLSLVYRF